MRDNTALIQAIEAEYDLDRGFLGRLRQGDFDPDGLGRLVELLKSIDLGQDQVIDRRLVALLWMIPTMMQWQLERVAELGGNVQQVQRGIDRVQAVLNNVLGVP